MFPVRRKGKEDSKCKDTKKTYFGKWRKRLYSTQTNTDTYTDTVIPSWESHTRRREGFGFNPGEDIGPKAVEPSPPPPPPPPPPSPLLLPPLVLTGAARVSSELHRANLPSAENCALLKLLPMLSPG
jgi:hypothetical protein